jgi:hypothetical protein
MDWLPIESAPKDGEHILAINSNRDQAVIYWTGFQWLPAFVVADYERAAKMWNDASGAAWSGIAARWMPLPPPPQAAKE